MTSMKSLQEQVKKFCRENNLNAPVEHRVLDLVSEVGEVAKEILKMSHYGKKPIEYREELKSELGDVLYSLISIANSFDIDMEGALNEVLEKYRKRMQKGSPGSEND